MNLSVAMAAVENSKLSARAYMVCFFMQWHQLEHVYATTKACECIADVSFLRYKICSLSDYTLCSSWALSNAISSFLLSHHSTTVSFGGGAGTCKVRTVLASLTSEV